MTRISILMWGVIVGMLMLHGCSTTQSTTIGADEVATAAPAPSRGPSPRLTINGADYPTLGPLVRAIGENSTSGGIVLLSGLEERPTAASNVVESPNVAGLKRLVGPTGCLVQQEAYYSFVYAPGYDALANYKIPGEVHARFQRRAETFAVGAGTDLYNALALLTQTLGTTVVADNIIADVWCGEIFLHDVPAITIVEALLQSARVLPEVVVAESTEAYLFLRSASNPAPADTCVNRNALTAEAQALLARKVDVRVPVGDGTMRFQREAVPLEAVLDDLAQQLGVPVTAEASVAANPVNQAAYLGMSVSDVLNIMVRQWPLARFGYRVQDSGIEFCARNQG